MTKEEKKTLHAHYMACDDLKAKFLESLYPNEPDYYDDASWIGDEIGGCLSWGDWFIGVENMASYFQYKFTPEEFFDWYDQYIDEEGTNYNMKTFKKLKPQHLLIK